MRRGGWVNPDPASTIADFENKKGGSATAVYSDGFAYAVAAVLEFNFNNGEATRGLQFER